MNDLAKALTLEAFVSLLKTFEKGVDELSRDERCYSACEEFKESSTEGYCSECGESLEEHNERNAIRKERYELGEKCSCLDKLIEDLGCQYINVYWVTREYGGPEEGGWWFTAGDPRESIFVSDKSKFDDLLAQKEKEVKEQNPRECSTKWLDGHLEVSVENHPAKNFPERTPRYE